MFASEAALIEAATERVRHHQRHWEGGRPGCRHVTFEGQLAAARTLLRERKARALAPEVWHIEQKIAHLEATIRAHPRSCHRCGAQRLRSAEELVCLFLAERGQPEPVARVLPDEASRAWYRDWGRLCDTILQLAYPRGWTPASATRRL